MASIFTRIIAGELPCWKVHEDELTFSFLSLFAIQPGHTLVVPKLEIDAFTDVPEPHYSAVFHAAKPLARAIQSATGCTRVGSMILGWDVPHFHLHLVPMMAPGELDPSKAVRHPDEANERMRARIVEALERGAASREPGDPPPRDIRR